MKREKRILDKYRKKVARQGIVSAVLCSVGAGGAAAFLAAFFCWLFSFKVLWVTVVAGIVAAAACIPVFYFTKFRANERETARRVDGTGLEERTITMVELSGDDSYIARLQRADAERAIAAAGQNGADKIPFRFAGGGRRGRRAAIFSSSALFAGLCMSAVLALCIAGIIPGGSELIAGTEVRRVLASYSAAKGGAIIGSAEQIVTQGDDAETVIALPDEGYVFVCWSDGYAAPTRQDKNVRKDFWATAIFEAIDKGDEDTDDPEEDEEEPKENSSSGPGGSDSQANNIYGQHNEVLDGETNYKNVYQQYYEKVKEYLASGEEIPEELRAFLDSYFKLLS